MRIKVLINYGGFNTNEKRILPGEYDADDPCVFGIADYLVENGHAVVTQADPPKPARKAKAKAELSESDEAN